MNRHHRIFVAGHRGLVGSAIVRRLASESFESLLVPSRSELDLGDAVAVEKYFSGQKPEYVFLAAAKVGGILANDSRPAEFIADNLKIQTNVIEAAHRHGVRKLLFLGSSCIYPKLAPQPLREDYLLTGPLEPTNEWYAIAKIAGLKMCQAFRRQYGFNAISAMPTNLYGPGDNFSLQASHVLPALMRKAHEARLRGSSLTIWGSGRPRREFLHVDDLADALVFMMRHYEEETPLNVGTGTDVSIAELASLVAQVVGFEGELVYDPSKPDGTSRKLLDVSRLTALGWTARIPLERGVRDTYQWFLDNAQHLRS